MWLKLHFQQGTIRHTGLSCTLKEDGAWTCYCSTGVPIVFELGLLVRPDIIHSFSGDDTDVDVVARAQVVHDPGLDGGPHQILGLLHLKAARRWDRDGIRTSEVTDSSRPLLHRYLHVGFEAVFKDAKSREITGSCVKNPTESVPK